MPRSLFLTTALFGLLAGCASVPDLGPQPVPAAAESFESVASFAEANGIRVPAALAPYMGGLEVIG